MYCKKCGGKIQDGVNICPTCGMIGDSISSMNFYSADLSDNKSYVQKRPKKKKKSIIVAVIICLLIVSFGVGGFVLWNNSRTYEVTGEWRSLDLIQLDDIIVQTLVEDAGIEEWLAVSIVDLLQLDAAKDFTFTFTPSGKILIGYNGESSDLVGDIFYEELGDNKMTLTYDNEIEIPIPAINLTIPIKFSKNIDYEVSKDTLSLYVNGKTIIFVRSSTPNLK